MDQPSVLPKILPYHLLEEMTDGFSEDRVLGRGTYGKVYLGLHKDGEVIAVKMLRPMLGLDDDQFEKEYHNLEGLRHQNIVRLVGYCNETRREFVSFQGKRVLSEVTHRALCFEFMQNGSLDSCLSDEYSGHDWHTRYAIIKGICKGLQYLHEELKPPIFHLDLKPANVLLDENRVAKIADFGLSRLMGTERTRITASPIGTIGYLPPEYINHRVISNKLDIFSLGVIILKIMAGPAVYSRSAEVSSQEFIDIVHENWRNRLQAASMDALESYCDQIRRCVTIALTCVEVDRHKRPTIGDIVNELNEADIASQFSSASRDSPGSSMDQGRQQTRRTNEEENWEREGRNNVENLFGVVVDDKMLNNMARYRGKPKMREDRAREANILVNEGGKSGDAYRYVHHLVPLFANSGTLCLVYNATGVTLYQVANHDWYGYIGGAPYPTEIGNGQWAAFRHASSLTKGSIAAVVYRGQNKYGTDHDYLLAWCVPSSPYRRNKCYCEIGGVGNFQNGWPSLKKKLDNSHYSSNTKSNGCETKLTMNLGLQPTFTAIIGCC
ncbi:hypothetical protein ACQ4PT_058119 [Festuca glaucescens]